MKKKILKLIILIIMLGSVAPQKAYSYTDSAPEIDVYSEENYLTLNWAKNISASDILWEINYDNTNEYNLNYWNAGNGGQAVKSYLGKKSLYTPPTNGTGNMVTTSSSLANATVNHIYYNKENKIPSNKYLSLSYRISTIGTTTLHIFTDWVYGNSFVYYPNKVNANYPKGSTQIGVDTISGLKVGDYITFDTDPANQKQNAYITNIDAGTRTLTLSEPSSENITYLTALKHRPQRYAIDSGYKTFKNTNGYKLFNSNFYSSSNTDIDFSSISSKLRQVWSSDSDTYITDLKLGYASKVVIYRTDNNARIYYGYDSTVTDITAVDKESPKTSLINKTKNNNNFSITLSALDYGTNYQYKICGTSDIGVATTDWNYKEGTVLSGVKEIRYKVTNNKNDNLGSNYLISSDGKININNITNTSYLLYAAVDDSGNIEKTNTILLDNTAPTSEVILSDTKTTDKPITITLNSMDKDSFISKIITPDGKVIENTKDSQTMETKYIAKENGIYKFMVYDSEGNIETKIVTINNIFVPDISISLSNNEIYFTDNNKEKTITVTARSNTTATLSLIGVSDFKAEDNSVISIENVDLKINSGLYQPIIKGNNHFIGDVNSETVSYNLSFKIKDVIGFKPGEYKGDILFSLNIK